MNIFHAFIATTIFSSVSWCSIDPPEHYLNEWVVRMKGGQEAAQLLALERGYIYKGKVLGFEDAYIFEQPEHPPRHKREAPHLTFILTNDPQVQWAEQLTARVRVKRGYHEIDPNTAIELQKLQNERNGIETEQNKTQSDEKLIRKRRNRATRRLRNRLNRNADEHFNDELWGDQWYLHHRETYSEYFHLSHVDMNVLPVYQMGYTGKGVRVSILDDGVEGTHSDLSDNYDSEISYDMNDNDPDPTPQYNGMNQHGTRCAGEVAMVANNEKCGVGVAFNARIGGVRMLDGVVTDHTEASSLGYAADLVDIYSSSWGPQDDGRTVDGPGRMVLEILNRGITHGRNGKGTIFVWASGNGGREDDSCSCDGYINNMHTLTISSATEHGWFPWYGEKCAAVIATAYSSGLGGEKMIVSTDLHNSCTTRHSGTSAAAPIAAGIIALMLEARPDLTWRDVQHILVRTSRYEPLRHNSGWVRNGAGLMTNTRFGFGLMDAYEMVREAERWEMVPRQLHCNNSFFINNEKLYPGHIYTFDLDIKCPNVKYLEHVELYVTISNSKRGALEVFLISPQGTRRQLLYTRKKDSSILGFKNWKFLSVMTWNEDPSGVWQVEVIDNYYIGHPGFVGNFSLNAHGTKEPPFYLNDNNIDSNTE